MPASKRYANLLVVIAGFFALSYGAALLWNRGVTSADMVIFAATYIPIAFGVTAGYHRLLAHRSFETSRSVRYVLAILGSAATQGPVIEWVADHRRHHSCSDREGDPHSPHVGHGDGFLSVIRGFWHAHVGWVLRTQGLADAKLYASDLMSDPGMRFINSANALFVLTGFLVPVLAGYLIDSQRGALSALLWGGFFRVALMHHVTFSVNSICHMSGRKTFRTADHSGNVAWLAIPTLGESWHHNHHAFPNSAYHGLRWWQPDITGLGIRAMRSVGLVWNVIDVSPEQERRKTAETKLA